MEASIENENRFLSVAEREMVAQTHQPGVDQLLKAELQTLGKRLREARDRSRRIASQQQREMRGKALPRGAAPAQDNTGSLGKTEVLVVALKRVTAALRKLNRPTTAQVLRKALDAKQAAAPQHPGPGQTAGKGMPSQPNRKPTVSMDPREIGRVSKATKVAQAKRDR